MALAVALGLILNGTALPAMKAAASDMTAGMMGGMSMAMPGMNMPESSCPQAAGKNAVSEPCQGGMGHCTACIACDANSVLNQNFCQLDPGLGSEGGAFAEHARPDGIAFSPVLPPPIA
jgi:hypothetical protein